MRLVTNEGKYLKLGMKPNLKDGKMFSEDLIGVEMGETKIKMMKSLYPG